MNSSALKKLEISRELDELGEAELEQVQALIKALLAGLARPKAARPVPTVADLLNELAAIQAAQPVELEIPPRMDRVNAVKFTGDYLVTPLLRCYPSAGAPAPSLAALERHRMRDTAGAVSRDMLFIAF